MYALPAAMYSEYGLVMVTLVPALGAPTMYRVAALVYVTPVFVAAIGVMSKEAIAPTVLVALMAEVTSVTVPVPMYSLAGVAAANTAVPLNRASPKVNVLTNVLKPEFDNPVVVRVVPLKVRLALSA